MRTSCFLIECSSAFAKVAYPACYVCFKDLKSEGHLVTHEYARNKHLLKVLDTFEDQCPTPWAGAHTMP